MPTFSIAAAISGLDSSLHGGVYEKLKEVHAVLEERGKYLRDDSRIAFLYAAGTPVQEYDTAEKVASELVLVDDLFAKTEYASLSQSVPKEVAATLKRERSVPWGAAWDATNTCTTDAVKYLLLSKNPSVLSSLDHNPDEANPQDPDSAWKNTPRNPESGP